MEFTDRKSREIRIFARRGFNALTDGKPVKRMNLDSPLEQNGGHQNQTEKKNSGKN